MLTVLFATRNRARILRDVLESYRALVSPASGWKMVVVDNGSTDETIAILKEYSSCLPLAFLTEPAPGKNAALNAGLARIEGDLTVFTDDDVFPRRDWLVELRRAADAHPEYSIFGGIVVPRWEVPPPPWIGWVDPGPVFTLSPATVKEGELSQEYASLVYGPNMLIRSEIFRAGVRFDAGIGPRGTSYPMGSETELVLRLVRQGHRAWHVTAAVVEHWIRKEQMQQEWVLRRGILCGRGRHRTAPKVPSWRGIPLHLVRDIPKEAISVFFGWASFRPDALFRARWRLNILRGKFIEARNMAEESSSRTASSVALSREAR